MQLPADEVDDKKMVRIPKALKIGTTLLLQGEKDDEKQCGRHDPPSNTRPRREIDLEERNKLLTAVLRISVSNGELDKVDHVRDDVNDRSNDHRPGRRLVERDILVKWYERIKGCTTKERDKVPADGEKYEYNIDMKHERGPSGKSWKKHSRYYHWLAMRIQYNGRTERNAKQRPCTHIVVVQLIVYKPKDKDENMKQDPGSEEKLTTALVNPPYSEFLSERKRFGGRLARRCSRIRALKSLKPPSLCFVALKMRRLRSG